MVLLYGYPESPFAQPKNVFFGHLVTAVVGLIVLHFIPLPIYVIIPLAVGFGINNAESAILLLTVKMVKDVKQTNIL